MIENRFDREPIPLEETLKPRWNSLCSRLGISEHQESFKDLCNHYNEPHRAYHTLNHLNNCFNEFDEIKSLLNNPDSVELAIWFHDAVYNISQHDNEGKSAQLAKDFCHKNNLSKNFIKKVEDHILATGNHELSTDPDTNYLIDIDMSILGYPPKTLYEYEDQIFKEYSTVYNRKEYIFGRLGFLFKLKDYDLYKTDYFKNKYGQSCQENIPKVIANLEKSYFNIQENEF